MNKYNSIKKVELSDLTLEPIYVSFTELWDMFEEIDETSLSKQDERVIKELYSTIDDYIKFRSNYTKTINDYLGE